MYSSQDIKNIKFSKGMGGYKQEDVDIFLDNIAADISVYERTQKEFQNKIESLNKELEELKASQSSLQSVLLSAQRLADKIVAEAKEKSEEIINNAESNISIITAREKELSTTFELKAQERKSQLEAELEEMVATANKKAEGITAAAEDSVARQQILFDKIKMEIASFKVSVSAKYKEHLEILASLPDSVPGDPKTIAQAVATAVDKEPDPLQFISKETKEEPVAETPEPTQKASSGFKVEDLIDSNETKE